MIGSLEGKVKFIAERYIIIEAAGVGYKIFATAETLRKLAKKEGQVRLWTHQHVREDILDLFGFEERNELELFETLINVPGVGPRTALGILNSVPADTLRRAIATGDLSYLTKVSGIGRKTAEKIMVELREKFGKSEMDAGALSEEKDAIDALESLGYGLREAREALSSVPVKVTGTSERVKAALKILGGGHGR